MYTNKNTNKNTTESNAHSIMINDANGNPIAVAEAKRKNHQPLQVGECVLVVVGEKKRSGAKAFPGLTPAPFSDLFQTFYNATYVQKNKEVPVEPGSVVICKIDCIVNHEFGLQLWVTPVVVVPAEVLTDKPGFIEMLARSGMFPNIKCRKKLTEGQPRWDWQSLAANVKLPADATRADIAREVVKRLVSGTIGIKTVLNAIVEIKPEVVKAEPASEEAEPASEGDQIGNQVGLHRDGIIVCATGDEGTSIAGAYVNGPTYQERQAAAKVRPPKGSNQRSLARKRGRNKTKSADNGKGNNGKGNNGKKSGKDK